MDPVMMEASNSTSASVQTVMFWDLFKPAEPMNQTICKGPCLDLDEYPETKLETVADDQMQGEVKPTMETAMDQLQDDFEHILHLRVKGVTSLATEPSSTTETSSFSLGFTVMEENFTGYHGLCPKECHDLRCIAERMSSKGRLDRLVTVYVSERKSFVTLHFLKLWDEKLCCGDVQRLEWNDLEKRIIRWIRAAYCSLRSIFAYEKRLSKQVFGDLGNATDSSCFIATVGDCATQLFDFAEAVSCCRRSERLPKILLLSRMFLELMPEINYLFDSEETKSIRNRAERILSKFAEVVALTLSDFEGEVLHEQSNYPPGGGIHRLTRHVMEYTSNLILEYRETLLSLITSRPPVDLGLSDGLELQSQSPLAAHMLRIIMVLQLNLENKSKFNPDPSLEHLFMVNNVYYIAQKIRQSLAYTEMIGVDYLKKLTENVEKSLTSYLKGSWDGLLYCLRNEGLNVSWSFTSGVSKSVVKERFKKFNALFTEIHRTHIMWSVPDPELRRKLHQAILGKLIPPYRDFLGQYRKHIESGKRPEKYIIYTVDELEAKILGLFGYHEFL